LPGPDFIAEKGKNAIFSPGRFLVMPFLPFPFFINEGIRIRQPVHYVIVTGNFQWSTGPTNRPEKISTGIGHQATATQGKNFKRHPPPGHRFY